MRELNHTHILQFITVDYFNELAKEVMDKVRKEKQEELMGCKDCIAFGPPHMRYYEENCYLEHSVAVPGGTSELKRCPNEEIYTNTIWERLEQILPQNKLKTIEAKV